MWHHRQVVRQRSAKPSLTSSNLVGASNYPEVAKNPSSLREILILYPEVAKWQTRVTTQRHCQFAVRKY